MGIRLGVQAVQDEQAEVHLDFWDWLGGGRFGWCENWIYAHGLSNGGQQGVTITAIVSLVSLREQQNMSDLNSEKWLRTAPFGIPPQSRLGGLFHLYASAAP